VHFDTSWISSEIHLPFLLTILWNWFCMCTFWPHASMCVNGVCPGKSLKTRFWVLENPWIWSLQVLESPRKQCFNVCRNPVSRAWQGMSKKYNNILCEHDISPLCQGDPVGPSSKIFGMLDHTFDVISVKFQIDCLRGLGGYIRKGHI